MIFFGASIVNDRPVVGDLPWFVIWIKAFRPSPSKFGETTTLGSGLLRIWSLKVGSKRGMIAADMVPITLMIADQSILPLSPGEGVVNHKTQLRVYLMFLYVFLKRT